MNLFIDLFYILLVTAAGSELPTSVSSLIASFILPRFLFRALQADVPFFIDFSRAISPPPTSSSLRPTTPTSMAAPVPTESIVFILLGIVIIIKWIVALFHLIKYAILERLQLLFQCFSIEAMSVVKLSRVATVRFRLVKQSILAMISKYLHPLPRCLLTQTVSASRRFGDILVAPFRLQHPVEARSVSKCPSSGAVAIFVLRWLGGTAVTWYRLLPWILLREPLVYNILYSQDGRLRFYRPYDPIQGILRSGVDEIKLNLQNMQLDIQNFRLDIKNFRLDMQNIQLDFQNIRNMLSRNVRPQLKRPQFCPVPPGYWELDNYPWQDTAMICVLMIIISILFQVCDRVLFPYAQDVVETAAAYRIDKWRCEPDLQQECSRRDHIVDLFIHFQHKVYGSSRQTAPLDRYLELLLALKKRRNAGPKDSSQYYKQLERAMETLLFSASGDIEANLQANIAVLTGTIHLYTIYGVVPTIKLVTHLCQDACVAGCQSRCEKLPLLAITTWVYHQTGYADLELQRRLHIIKLYTKLWTAVSSERRLPVFYRLAICLMESQIGRLSPFSPTVLTDVEDCLERANHILQVIEHHRQRLREKAILRQAKLVRREDEARRRVQKLARMISKLLRALYRLVSLSFQASVRPLAHCDSDGRASGYRRD